MTTRSTTRTKTQFSRGSTPLVLSLIALLTFATLIATLSGGIPAVSAQEGDLEVVEVEPIATNTPLPTSTPTPSPTPTSTPEPLVVNTIAPEPTTVPTDPSPTVAPTQPVLVTITPTPTSEAPEPTVTPTDTPETPEPTPTPAPLTDTLRCDTPIESEDPDGTWRFASTCSYVASQDRLGTELSLELDAAAQRDGWTIRARSDRADAPWSNAAGTATFTDETARDANGRFTVQVEIIAPESADRNATATVEVRSEAITEEYGRREGPQTSVRVTVPESEPAPMMAAAASGPSASISVSSCGYISQEERTYIYECSYVASFSGSSGQADITIGVESAPSTWGIDLELDSTVFNEVSDVPGTGRASLTWDKESGRGDWAGTLTIELTAPGSSSIGTMPSLTYTHECGAPFKNSCKSASPPPITPPAPPPACTTLQNANINAAITSWQLDQLPYSQQSQVSTGELAIEVSNPQTCTDWSVSISGQPGQYSGFAPQQQPIPLGNFRIIKSETDVLTMSVNQQPLITNGPAVNPSIHTFGLEVDIPAGAAAGSYTATFTVTSSSAPGT